MKLKDEVGVRIKAKIDLLNTHKGLKMHAIDPTYSRTEKDQNIKIINSFIDDLEKKIHKVEPLIRSMNSHIKHIGGQDRFVASYLLIGKSFSSLKLVSFMAKKGFSYQINEIVRSTHESLSLAGTFLGDLKEKRVKQWFKGKIISHEVSRKVRNAAVNKMIRELGFKPIPLDEALSDVYSVYSSYTHNGYAAIFDYIDVFNEDFDFEQSAQFTYTKKNLSLITDLYVNLLLMIKFFYMEAQDLAKLKKTQLLLSDESKSFVSLEKAYEEMNRYKK